MNRAFICAKQNFPRGSAGANYIQYLALALKEIGYYPIVISSGIYSKCTLDEVNNKYFYQGIEFYNPFIFKSKVQKHIEFSHYDQVRFVQALDHYSADDTDVIISYLMEEGPLKHILKYAQKRKINCAACVVEWLPKSCFKNKRKYNSYMRSMTQIIPCYNVVLPITRYIADKYEDFSCRTLVLPIMTDVKEYDYVIPVTKQNKIKLIFPVNGVMKDSMASMLLGLGGCSKEIRDRLEFHITNYSMEKVERDLAGCSNHEIVKNAKALVVIHKWLEYSALVNLYKEMDYLLLVRDTNQMTLANFPSKVPETMTHGVIPIASRVGDYTDLYLRDRYNSIVFDGCSPEACIKAITRAVLLQPSEVEQMRMAARRTAEEVFDYHNWVMKLSQLFPVQGK